MSLGAVNRAGSERGLLLLLLVLVVVVVVVVVVPALAGEAWLAGCGRTLGRQKRQQLSPQASLQRLDTSSQRRALSSHSWLEWMPYRVVYRLASYFCYFC